MLRPLLLTALYIRSIAIANVVNSVNMRVEVNPTASLLEPVFIHVPSANVSLMRTERSMPQRMSPVEFDPDRPDALGTTTSIQRSPPRPYGILGRGQSWGGGYPGYPNPDTGATGATPEQHWEYSLELPISFATCVPKGAWNAPPWNTRGKTIPSVGDTCTANIPFPGYGIPDGQLRATKKCLSYTLNDYELLFSYTLTESNFFPAGYGGELRVFLDSTNASRTFVTYWATWPQDTTVTAAAVSSVLLQMTFRYWGEEPDAPATTELNKVAAAAGNSGHTYRFGLLLASTFETCVPNAKWDAKPWDTGGQAIPSIGDERHLEDTHVKTTVANTAYESSNVYYMHAYTTISSNLIPVGFNGTIEIYKDMENPSQVFVQYFATWPSEAHIGSMKKNLLEVAVRAVCGSGGLAASPPPTIGVPL